MSSADRAQKIVSWLRSPALGIPLTIGAFFFVARSWSDSWGSVKDLATEASWSGAVSALLLYTAALIGIAAGIMMSLKAGAGIFWGALAGQILKYIPGALWQGLPTAAESSVRGILSYATITLGAACAGLLFSRQPATVIVGGVLCALLLALGLRHRPAATTLKMGSIVAVVALAIAGSGAAVGATFGMDPITWGRDLATAWGLGVLTVPIPAGLGIRELAITAFSDADTATIALVATSHRAVTFIGDALVGTVGLLAYSRTRSR